MTRQSVHTANFWSRRQLLQSAGAGFGALALDALTHRDKLAGEDSNLAATNPLVCNGDTTTVTVSATGGTGPFTFVLASGALGTSSIASTGRAMTHSPAELLISGRLRFPKGFDADLKEAIRRSLVSATLPACGLNLNIRICGGGGEPS